MNIIIVLIFLLILFYFIYIYNLHRYALLHFTDSDFYINNYSNINKKSVKKVILSLTTTPNRINKIEPMLKSLLDQTIRVDQIALNLPLESNSGDEYKIPNNIEKICNIYRSGKDYGPGTKFIPTLLREGDIDTTIILLDDDYIYGKDFIEKLMDYSEKNEDKCIVSDHAILIKPEYIDIDILKSNKKYIDNEWIKKYIKSDIIELPYDKNFRNLFM